MKLWAPGLVLCLAMAGCGDGVPFNGPETEGPGDTTPGSVYLSEDDTDLTANNISYDPVKDELTINNIPFDDPNNTYVNIPSPNFSTGFRAYQSDPEAGSQEFQYFAVFQRSESGLSQVAATQSNEYIEFGFGGAGAQRIAGSTTLPSSGIYSYTGDYAAVRVVRTEDANDVAVEELYLVKGGMEMTADFGDFDAVDDVSGAVGGVVRNRTIYDRSGQLLGNLDGIISFANSEINLSDGTIASSDAVELQGGTQTLNDGYQGGEVTATGKWRGVFAGPGGEEIAGIVFVQGGEVREIGGVIVTCTSAACND